jgi:glycosyltransferase involved in cell wall biosynthesis
MIFLQSSRTETRCSAGPGLNSPGRLDTPDQLNNPGRFNIASISTLYPSVERPHQGVFVERRLSSLAEIANVRVIRPVPWFPILRPLRQEKVPSDNRPAGLTIFPKPMFYVPGVLKLLDAYWLEKSILPVLRNWQRRDGVDLVDAHFGYPEGVGGVRAAAKLGLPVFVTLRGNEIKYLKQRSIGRQLLAALEICTGIITVSHSLKQAIVSRGVLAEKIRVIPNAVDLATFRPGSRSQARALLNLPNDRRFLISVGHLVFEKGHHLAIEALRRIRQSHTNAELIIVGGASNERDYPRRIRKLVADSGLAGSVHFVGIQTPDRVATWLQAADVFVLASFREGCCNAVLEALACGLPVVTTAVGDNEHYVRTPENGFVVPAGELEPLVQAGEAALSRSWNSRNIADSIVQRGGWNRVAAEVADFFAVRIQRGESMPSAHANAAADPEN